MRCVDPSILTAYAGRPIITTLDFGPAIPLALGMDVLRLEAERDVYTERLIAFIDQIFAGVGIPGSAVRCRFGVTLHDRPPLDEPPYSSPRAIVFDLHLADLEENEIGRANRLVRIAATAAHATLPFRSPEPELLGPSVMLEASDVAAMMVRDQPDLVAAILATDVAACERRAIEAEQAAERDAQAREHAAELAATAATEAAERVSDLAADLFNATRKVDAIEFAGLLVKAHPAIVGAILAMHHDPEPVPPGSIDPKRDGIEAADDLAAAEREDIGRTAAQGKPADAPPPTDADLLEQEEAYRDRLIGHTADATQRIGRLRIDLGMNPSDQVTLRQAEVLEADPVDIDGHSWEVRETSGLSCEVTVTTSGPVQAATVQAETVRGPACTFPDGTTHTPLVMTSVAEPAGVVLTPRILRVDASVGRALGMVPEGEPGHAHYLRGLDRFARMVADAAGTSPVDIRSETAGGDVFASIQFPGLTDGQWSAILAQHARVAEGVAVLEEARTLNWHPRA